MSLFKALHFKSPYGRVLYSDELAIIAQSIYNWWTDDLLDCPHEYGTSDTMDNKIIWSCPNCKKEILLRQE